MTRAIELARLRNFFDALKQQLELMRRVRHSLNIRVAEDFTVFDYILEHEPTWSRIIADLLKPDGSHAQGFTFLNAFLEVINIAVPNPLGEVTVVPEDPTTHLTRDRKIDVVVRSSGFTLAIENKPWDREQPQQMSDYLQHLQRKCGESFVLVYLSGDGSPPRSLTSAQIERLKARDQYRTISYPVEFRQWLTLCAMRSKSDRVRWFLDDVEKYVAANFRLQEAS